MIENVVIQNLTHIFIGMELRRQLNFTPEIPVI